MSAAVLGVADATGQVTYTDIEPDVVLAVGDTYNIDFTGTGAQNVEISNPDGLAGGNAALAFPSSGGAFVGFTAGGFEYPSLLIDGDAVGPSETFTTPGERGDLNYYGCAYSNSQWCDEVVDGLLGVRFTFDGNTHYGWVRMDTDVNGSNEMVVKGFAFEATPDTAIEAGDEGSPLGVADQAFNNFSYFTDANTLTLSAATAMDNVTIHNISGQQVSTSALTSNNERVDISALSTGVYLATVTIEGTRKTIKFVKR
ncbi:MAG: T9SS type A sorting domain-containing protein [Marinirhabdus sp.]|nr:T9SS type A sorting domain-containing protein [Marinirhabdus sp.]